MHNMRRRDGVALRKTFNPFNKNLQCAFLHLTELKATIGEGYNDRMNVFG